MRTLTLTRLTGLLLFATTAPVLAQTPIPGKTYREEEVEVVPKFEKGDAALREFLTQKTLIPPFATTNLFGGTVDVEFVLLPDGRFDSLQVTNSVCCGMDEEAVRVTRLLEGRWLVGKVGGQPVRTRVEVNVPFKVAYQTSVSVKKLTEMRRTFENYRLTPAYPRDQNAYRAAVETQTP